MKRVADPSQLNLLDLLKDLRPQNSEFSSFSIDIRLRKTVRQAIKECPQSRYEIAARMSEALDLEVSKDMIDSWTAESREGVNRFPACYLPVFCHVVGSIEPLRVLADLLGCFVIQGPEALDLELKRIEDKKKVLADRERAIKAIRQGLK